MSPRATSRRYLNVILTVNAALLGAIVLGNVVGDPASPAFTSAAHAAPQTPPGGGGIPNAGGQRERMIDELVAIRESIDGLKKTIETGKMKVTIGNIDELKAASKPVEEKGK